MKEILLVTCAIAPLLCCAATSNGAKGGPFEGGKFKGRIAYSADGNHNDPDDWAASPLALAIFAECGLKERLVHFDYNCILPETNPDWEKTHAESVLGAAERCGFDRSVFHDCRTHLDRATASITKAINDSSAENPLYFIVAGPMELPYLGIQKSAAEKRKFVYCISHSRWNDGFDSKYKFTHTKRSVIEADVNWVQIKDQNPLLSLSPYGRPASPAQFAAYQWMRDSRDAKVQFLWERMLVSTRPDPSDAGMAYFLMTGDEECDPTKLKRLIEDHIVPRPITERTQVRIEAENFRHLSNFTIEYRNDVKASHRVCAALTNAGGGLLRTRLDEPFVAAHGRCNIDIRYFDEQTRPSRFALFVNGQPKGAAVQSPGEGRGWTTQTIHDVEIRIGDEINVEVQGRFAKLDYVQFNY